jgi:hypothetical protein
MGRLEGSRKQVKVRVNLHPMQRHGNSKQDSHGRHKAQHRQPPSFKRPQAHRYP